MEKDMTNIIIKSLNDKLEEYFIEGLRLKGFEFKSKVELEEFIKSNCRCEDYADIKQRTYFVNNVPFFFHDYNIVYEPIDFSKPYEIKANYGLFKYL